AARNVISGNGEMGILLAGDCDGVNVLGNYIGVAVDGVTPVPNSNGIVVAPPNHQVVIGGAESGVGGPSAAGRNIISGNTNDGVQVFGEGDTRVRGNFIGTDKDGAAAVPNGRYGILLQSVGSTVGGPAAGAGNLISGNGAGGVGVGLNDDPDFDFIAARNLIVGNYIGTDRSGTAAIPNRGAAGVTLAGE